MTVPEASSDHRTATAERNVEAILDATEALLARGTPATTTAVAAEAGVSRVTVYAHFPTREALLEGVAERVIARFGAALERAELERGSAADALARLIALAWSQLDRYSAVADAVIDQLSPAALGRAHLSLHEPITALIERGRTDRTFRTDLPAPWLLSCYFALVHTCGDQVRSGVIEQGAAVDVLQRTIGDLFASR